MILKEFDENYNYNYPELHRQRVIDCLEKKQSVINDEFLNDYLFMSNKTDLNPLKKDTDTQTEKSDTKLKDNLKTEIIFNDAQTEMSPKISNTVPVVSLLGETQIIKSGETPTQTPRGKKKNQKLQTDIKSLSEMPTQTSISTGEIPTQTNKFKKGTNNQSTSIDQPEDIWFELNRGNMEISNNQETENLSNQTQIDSPKKDYLPLPLPLPLPYISLSDYLKEKEKGSSSAAPSLEDYIKKEDIKPSDKSFKFSDSTSKKGITKKGITKKELIASIKKIENDSKKKNIKERRVSKEENLDQNILNLPSFKELTSDFIFNSKDLEKPRKKGESRKKGDNLNKEQRLILQRLKKEQKDILAREEERRKNRIKLEKERENIIKLEKEIRENRIKLENRIKFDKERRALRANQVNRRRLSRGEINDGENERPIRKFEKKKR